MLADPFVANVIVASGGAITRNWHLVSMAGNASVRANIAHTPGAPSTLKISHQTVGNGGNKRDRHLVRLEALQVTGGVEDSTKPPIVLYVVADLPSGCDATLAGAVYSEMCGMLLGKSGDTAFPLDWSRFFNPWKSGQS